MTRKRKHQLTTSKQLNGSYRCKILAEKWLTPTGEVTLCTYKEDWDGDFCVSTVCILSRAQAAKLGEFLLRVSL